ncbi:MAG: hypothetical protein US48_C0005G0010 [Candidatus Levybacteria bacterium GW2011_GWA2_37_36]|nr:MAG: hypothetical protein US43_C0007G0007 [Candidatus Levybacteria bacterium GW2011_GWA1_37_16]KKQ33985.1 MAG: hypothetical protein US48_C0005G0010 [Candidatus Levybacteria bacterium GW2011_GWA2_37_36]KKQ38196.1 MAG: hypothetical protein US55_C0012G0008 [Candidatus Levybacteria bacterium GW2011_GWC2_37_7]KKQ42710.1 MAG: hypothetical protein US59_C0005G0011 [Candidatus Levybacteria bacterium GW2011_GWB1_37_8]OGH50485.1 MAG: hypothetical protein A3H17_00260 [Candidatus Levybacteria bacterium R
MKNNIEGEKSRNPIRKVAKRLVGPATVLTLLFTAGAAVGCEGKTVNNYINIPPIAGTPRPSEAAGTPLPTETAQQAFDRGVKAQQTEEQKAKDAKAEFDRKVAEEVAKRPKETVTVPGPTMYAPSVPSYQTPDMRQYPNWIGQPASSELYVPSYGTSIDKSVGPNQIGVISGGPMTVDYLDQYGFGRSSTFYGGADRGTLIFFLGNGQYYSRQVNARNVVQGQNWFGLYNMPDGNPANPNEWQALVNAKRDETFKFGGIQGGTRYVDVLVIGADNRVLLATTAYRGY